MNKTDCRLIALPTQRHASVSKVLEAAGGSLEVLDVPELEDLLFHEIVDYYPYTKTWDEAYWEPLFVTHTSGTTGIPKTVVCRHGLAGCWDALHRLPNGPDGAPIRHRYREDQIIFSVYPLFHVSCGNHVTPW